jgi:acetyltransferase-like isoleucine patch superfamily enzyme
MVNLIHKPKEGVFKRKKEDRDYLFWSLRAVIKKWPIWLTRFVPLHFADYLLYRFFGVKSSFSNSLTDFTIDSEFIEIGKGTVIGKGSFIRSSMIIDDFLVIKKVIIEENVTIGSQCYISPGTHVGKKAILLSFSITNLDQKLAPNAIYSGNPAIKRDVKIKDRFSILSEKNLFFEQVKNKDKDLMEQENIEHKFVKKVPTYVIIFLLINLVSYGLPVILSYFFYKIVFQPYFMTAPSLIQILIEPVNLMVFLISPAIYILLYLLNLLLVAVTVKIIYIVINRHEFVKKGTFHWSTKSKAYKQYFVRSFLIRYLKWKVQRCPFPWLTKPFFNYVGNCHFGEGTTLEDMHIAKEFLNVGPNSYLGKIVLTNHLWDKHLTVNDLEIGENSVISDGSCISPGTKVGNNATLLPFTMVPKNAILASDSYYSGLPPKKVDEENFRSILSKLLNINNKNEEEN